ncbi:MAG: CoB--CoM heterodisulfide reductase iron-sulfur subunit A family protein [Bacteroidetes bacterium]|nr:CoB--CoM heterodisulfide reductase iron-sulfur subunit A family protein [Bacteroidota bacterium]MCK4287781.1 CoB--CoM heterodisulfide reductase iron-sulfur subunit A family protein [Bacteroidales bacterium]MCK4406032.1 CoB--CoM heterodisulfide reductase iron-sulfur subunit A family protein [Bacteroidales bacterium]
MKKRIGVYICHCGSNISDYVDVEKVKEIAGKENEVVLSKTTMFACADSAQNEIVEDIKEQNLDAIVVASCSPKLHLFTFRNVAQRAGLNPYNYIQVNVREQCSWAHSDNPPKATEKAIKLVLAGIERAKHSQALTPISIPSNNAVLVVGAGIAGMRAAIELAEMGTEVFLIEREYFVGGRASQWNELFTTNETGREVVSRLYNKIIKTNNITLFTGADIDSKSGSVGDFDIKIKIEPRYVKSGCKLDWAKFKKAVEICPVEFDDPFNFGLTKQKAIYKNYPSEFPEIPAIDFEHCNKCGECVKICSDIDLEQKEEILNINVGAVLLTTGASPYEPEKGEFGYKEIDNIITLQQLKRLIELREDELIYHGNKIKNIAYIYCVGSRQVDGENKYCSRYCCTSAIHTAIMLKEKYKGINNFHFTRGIRTYGKQEILYNKASKQGDIFLQSFEDSPTEVYNEKGQTVVKIKDILTADKELEVNADLVVLVTGMVPRENNSINNILKVPIGRDKFYNEIHPKLRPVETVIDGVLIAGACQAPLNITESVKSSLSAAAKVNSLISKGEIELEPTLAQIDKLSCNWCDKCTAVCPYDAIVKKEYDGKTVAVVNEANCKGCGICLPVCPSNSIQLIGYTDVEIESMIDALID